MGPLHRAALVSITLSAFAATALADAPQDGAPPSGSANDWAPPGVTEDEKPDENEPKEPGRGDFDAGGQLRLPSGPDDMGEFATFNWVAVDLVGRYFLLDSVTINGTIPVAIIKPDDYMGTEPAMIGGMNVRLEARMPKMPFGPKSAKESDIAVVLSGAYMREGAMLLSAKDFPYFSGDFQPGLTAGAIAKVKLSTLIDFSMTPLFVYQSGTVDALTAVQIPTSLILGLGSVAKVSADLGIFTGDDYSFRGSNNGRLSAGGSLTLKLGPILAHAGAGVASLLTGGMYPTIRDSVYIDLNVKYAK